MAARRRNSFSSFPKHRRQLINAQRTDRDSLFAGGPSASTAPTRPSHRAKSNMKISPFGPSSLDGGGQKRRVDVHRVLTAPRRQHLHSSMIETSEVAAYDGEKASSRSCSNSALRKPLLSAKERKPHWSRSCGNTATRRASLSGHTPPVTPPRGEKASSCSNAAPWKPPAVSFLVRQHFSAAPVVCSSSGRRTFPSSDRLARSVPLPMKKQIPAPLSTEGLSQIFEFMENGRYRCLFCRAFNEGLSTETTQYSLSGFKKHVKHHSDKHECKTCLNRFLDSATLGRHKDRLPPPAPQQHQPPPAPQQQPPPPDPQH